MKVVLLALTVLVSISVVSAACGYGDIDLSGLTTSTDYMGTDGTYQYNMNVCGKSTKAGCVSKAGGTASICQFNGGTLTSALGVFEGTNPTWSYIGGDKTKGVQAHFTNADKCYVGGQEIDRPVDVIFRCSGSDSTTVTVVESPQCTFTLTMDSKKACPGGGGGGGGSGSSSGLSGGWVFIIILLVLVPVYILVGCIYKRKKLGSAGSEACPNYDFWKEVPGYVKDGFRFIFVNKCKRGSSYSNL